MALATKFQLKQAILIFFFGPNLPKRGYSHSKFKKANITIESSCFVPNFLKKGKKIPECLISC